MQFLKKYAFEIPKTFLSNKPLLDHPEFDKTFNLTVDACNYVIGVILPEGPMGKDKSIAYAYRTLNSAEQSYSTIEKELHVIFWGKNPFNP